LGDALASLPAPRGQLDNIKDCCAILGVPLLSLASYERSGSLPVVFALVFELIKLIEIVEKSRSSPKVNITNPSVR